MKIQTRSLRPTCWGGANEEPERVAEAIKDSSPRQKIIGEKQFDERRKGEYYIGKRRFFGWADK